MEQMYSVKEVAAKFGIAEVTLRKHIRNGLISYYRIVDRILFTQQQVTAFLDSCQRPS
jgi:excisionase family DNA binding protein